MRQGGRKVMPRTDFAPNIDVVHHRLRGSVFRQGDELLANPLAQFILIGQGIAGRVGLLADDLLASLHIR